MKQRSAIAESGHKFRTKNISKRVQKIVISPIKEMSILADQLEEQIGMNKIISFGQGIPYLDTPDYIKAGAKKALDKISTAKYTLEPGITELRNLVARFLEKEKRIKNVKSKKEIMISVGCQEAMACALATALDPGDEALIPSPAYASHIEQILQFNGVPKFAPMIEKNGWRLDFDKLEKAVTKKTKIVILSNPSNPTGAVLSKKELSKLARFIRKHNLILISDETYDFLTYDGIKHVSAGSIPFIRDRVIVTSSFSKKYRTTGYRVGYAFADEGIIDHMLKVHDALTICAPAISQEAAIIALKEAEKSRRSVKDLVNKMTYNRTLVCRELDKMSEYLEYQKPMGAYYVFAKIKIPEINSFKLALRILNEARIIVIPGAAFGPGGEGYLRFSFAGKPENIKRGFARLRGWFQNWKKEGYEL